MCGFIEITETATGKVLFDSRGKVTKITERAPVSINNEISYTGPVIEETELFTGSNENSYSEWLKTEDAAKYGFKSLNKIEKA